MIIHKRVIKIPVPVEKGNDFIKALLALFYFVFIDITFFRPLILEKVSTPFIQFWGVLLVA
jgi:hypothetical protein